jgi:hypothetical protein
MPSDITGTEILDEDQGGRRLHFVKGPIFAQIILPIDQPHAAEDACGAARGHAGRPT